MIPQLYWIPFVVANAFGLFVLALAFWRRDTVRWVGAGVFACASVINTWTALTDPGVYVNYAAMTPSEAYRQFILGWFGSRIQIVVLLIAVGQLGVAALMASRRDHWRRFGVAGAEIFLLAVAPLGVGAAFPFSLTFGAGLLAALAHEGHVSRALQLTVHWLPRAAAVALAVIFAALALDAWRDATTVLERSLAIGLHLVPAILAVVTLVVAWRSPRTAGALCFALAIAYAVLPGGRIVWMLVIAAPLVVEGVLFLLSARFDAEVQQLAGGRPVASR